LTPVEEAELVNTLLPEDCEAERITRPIRPDNPMTRLGLVGRLVKIGPETGATCRGFKGGDVTTRVEMTMGQIDTSEAASESGWCDRQHTDQGDTTNCRFPHKKSFLTQI
jgi:hypothetical protein